mgnify:FL=1
MIVGYIIVQEIKCPNCGEVFGLMNRVMRRLHSKLVYCITHISHNDLPEFPSAALSSIDDATASPHSSALQAENSFCAIMLKVNETVH